jgi:hypothetical protein
LAIQPDGPFVYPIDPTDEIKKRALTASAPAKNGYELTWIKIRAGVS